MRDEAISWTKVAEADGGKAEHVEGSQGHGGHGNEA